MSNSDMAMSSKFEVLEILQYLAYAEETMPLMTAMISEAESANDASVPTTRCRNQRAFAATDRTVP
jgi:hypothetical protein